MIWNSEDAVRNISSKKSKHFTCQINIKIAIQLKHNNHDKNMQCALRTIAPVLQICDWGKQESCFSINRAAFKRFKEKYTQQFNKIALLNAIC